MRDFSKAQIINADGMGVGGSGGAVSKEVRRDAISSAFLARELEVIESQIYEEKYGPRKSSQLIPFNTTTLPRWARTYSYKKMTGYGLSEFMSRKPGSIPLANILAEDKSHPIHEHAIGYRLWMSEVMESQQTGVKLPVQYPRAALAGAETVRDQVLFSGLSQLGITGLFNEPTVPVITATNYGGGTTWASKTPDEQLKDVNEWVQTIITNSNEAIEVSDLVLLLPQAAYQKLNNARTSTSDTTVRRFLEQNVPGLSMIEYVRQLNTASATSAGRAMLYIKRPEVVEALFAMMFEFVATEEHAFYTDRFGMERLLGLVWRFPLGALYIDGIAA